MEHHQLVCVFHAIKNNLYNLFKETETEIERGLSVNASTEVERKVYCLSLHFGAKLERAHL